MGNFYVGITDTSWFNYICTQYKNGNLNQFLNFWTPGKKEFKVLEEGELFLFKLHNKMRNEHGEIVGGGYFYGYEKMSPADAWSRFGNGNGTNSLLDMQTSINGYRKKNNMSTNDDEIGCIILYNFFFLDQCVEEPVDWGKKIVSGKKYDTSSEIGKKILDKVFAIGGINQDIEIINENEEATVASQLQDEKRAFVKIRVNQDVFRERLIKRYGKCCICSVENTSLLRASHIKPWAESESSEKLDTDNGFLLCPNHDALFDGGFISFDNDGKVLTSNRISKNDYILTNIRDDMKVELTEKNKSYLEYHRKYVFK